MNITLKKVRFRKASQCFLLMLEGGADISLEIGKGDGLWENVFVDAIEWRSLVNISVYNVLACANPLQSIVKHMLDYMEPFLKINGIYNHDGQKCSALTSLVNNCGYKWGNALDVVAKAILLLNRKADIYCDDEQGDTVLHTVLKC
jgi:hypothetical protein